MESENISNTSKINMKRRYPANFKMVKADRKNIHQVVVPTGKDNKGELYEVAAGWVELTKKIVEYAKRKTGVAKDFSEFLSQANDLSARIKTVADNTIANDIPAASSHINIKLDSIIEKLNTIAKEDQSLLALTHSKKRKSTHNSSLSAKGTIVVRAKDSSDHKTYAEITKSVNNLVNFKQMAFAPTSIKHTSNGTIRLTFNNEKQRDTVLNKLNTSSVVTAELAKRRRPLIILKGISNDVLKEDLISTITVQNINIKSAIKTDDDLKLRFIRTNKNNKLYNAVMEVSSTVRRAMINNENRICIEHQRVHVSDFSHFIQCFKCLKFGHIQSKCQAKDSICGYCAENGHNYKQCPMKNDASKIKCANCHTHNLKYKKSNDIKHSGTSHRSCPEIKAMIQVINERTDYD